jgi:SAM-dependent methyltransferase
MLFLTDQESRSWKGFAEKVLKDRLFPGIDLPVMRPGLLPAFHFYIGTYLLSKGINPPGEQWINAGISGEPGGLFSNAYLASYLRRNNGRLVIPEVIFSDPAPYVHFAGTPVLVNSRARFFAECCRALPRITAPLKIMDIGCGHGQAVTEFLGNLRKAGLIDKVDEILLIDPSEGMLKLARENTSLAFPEARITVSHGRFEAFSERIEGHYHVALASLAYHHMPFETKKFHLEKLREHIDQFVLFEVDANNDSPDIGSPEMALSVYQSYGPLFDFVFANDAAVDLAISSIDRFLMSEAIYFFTEPRGRRTDYHMLRSQWHQVFREGLGMGFDCLCDSACYGDENMSLFTMIYGR